MKTQVLMVDDERDFVEALRGRLNIRDFDVRVALSGDQAIDVIRRHEIDVVILDVCMPHKNGLDTLIEIKKLDPLIEVIMLTGHAEVDTSIAGLNLGAGDYLVKPIQLDELVGKIEQAAKRKKLEKERKDYLNKSSRS